MEQSCQSKSLRRTKNPRLLAAGSVNNDLVFHLETLDLTPAIASLPTTVIGQVLASEQPIEAIKQWLDTEFRVALSGALTDEVLNYLEETVRDFDPFIGIVSLPADEL